MAIFVRSAVEGDVTWLIEQLREFSEFFGTRKKLFPSAEQVEGPIRDLIARQVVLIAEDARRADGDTRLGFIAGTLSGHPFNPDIRVLAEMFWWVSRSARATSAAARLLNAFVDLGKASADWITMSMIGPSHVSEDHLLKRGFQLHERAYLMEV